MKTTYRSDSIIPDDSLMTEELLCKISEIIDSQTRNEIEEYEARGVAFSGEINEMLLNMARSKDAEIKRKKKRDSFRKWSRFAAIFLICIISVGSITMVNSSAFRVKIFNLFSNNESDSITLRNAEEESLLKEWNGYWYPTYLPEGFHLEAVDEPEHFLLYLDQGGNREIRIYDAAIDGSFSFDTKNTKSEKIRVGIYEAYLFENEQAGEMIATWLTEDKTIVVAFSNINDKEIIKKIVNNMDYIAK